MVMFAVSGAIVLAFVCWAMLRESPPAPAPQQRDDTAPAARTVDHVEGDATMQAAENGAVPTGDELEPPAAHGHATPREHIVRTTHEVQPVRDDPSRDLS